MMKLFLTVVFGLLFALCFVMFSGLVTQSRQTNVVFILVDDLGWRDLSVYGSSFYETPNIDRLAASSMRFSSAYASAPICSPTRAALLTGKHPARLQITNWIPGDNPQDRRLLGAKNNHQLSLDEVTMAEAFKRLGYKTFFAGKWHLGESAFYPEHQGFDTNLGGLHKGQPPGGYYSPYSNPTLKDGPAGEYLPDRLTDEVIHFIEQADNQPFFAYLSYYTVHTPLQASRRHIDKFNAKLKTLPMLAGPEQLAEHGGWTKQKQNNANYASMVYAMDENVGRLLARLETLGLSKNTIVVFTSDNGGRSTLYGPGDATSNLPLRAGKGWLYEGGLRVPLIIRAPGLTQANSNSDEPVISTDLFPTLLDIAGHSLLSNNHVDGLSLKPLMDGEASLGREAVHFYYPHYHGSASLPTASIRAGNWKLIHFFESGVPELYHLGNDIGETHDLAAAEPKLTAMLGKRLDDWLRRVGAERPSMNQQYVKGAEKISFEGMGEKQQ